MGDREQGAGRQGEGLFFRLGNGDLSRLLDAVAGHRDEGFLSQAAVDVLALGIAHHRAVAGLPGTRAAVDQPGVAGCQGEIIDDPEADGPAVAREPVTSSTMRPDAPEIPARGSADLSSRS
jgi:hypothetical protein